MADYERVGPGTDGLTLEELAHELGVEDFLDKPITAIVPFLADRSLAEPLAWHRGSVRDADEATFAAPGARYGIRAAARVFLLQCVNAREISEARARRWKRVPEHQGLATLQGRLRTFLAELGHTRPTPTPNGLLGARIELDDERVLVRLKNAQDPRGASLRLAGFEEGRIVGVGPPDVIVWMAMQLMDTIAEPSSALYERLARATEIPGWQRLCTLLATEREVASEPEPASPRISFRLEVEGPHLALAAYLHKPSKRGWTAGARKPFPALRELPKLERADRRVLAALSGYDETSQGDFVDIVGDAREVVLDELADHPSVHLSTRATERLRLRRVDASAALLDTREDDAQLTLALRVGPAYLSPVEASEQLALGSLAYALQDDGEGATLLYAHVPDAVASVIHVAGQLPVGIPHAAWERLLDVLPDAATALGLDLPASLDDRAEPADLALVLRIEPLDTGARLALRVRPAEGAPTQPLASGPRTLVEVQNGERRLRTRDVAEETRRGEALRSELGLPRLGLPAQSSEWTWTLESDEVFLGLLDSIAERRDLEVEWPDRKVRVAGRIRDVSLSVKSAAHWFSVGGEVTVDGEAVSLAALLAAVRSGSRFVRLGADRFAAIGDELRTRLERAADVVVPYGRGELGIVAASGDALEALGELVADARWRELRARLSAPPEAPLAAPSELRADLRAYQLEGFRWLHRCASLEQGACLADDMGLGKTVQALAMLLARAELGPALVVAPTSLGDNWRSEAARFAPSLRVHVHRGPGRGAVLADLGPGDVLVASYDVVALDIAELEPIRFATLVVDEAQALKNAASLRAKAVARITAGWRIALTGTPIENRLSELWSIFAVVHPGLLGTWEHFRERFARPIERDRDHARLSVLSRLVRPFVLRRKKEEVATDLPPRLEITRMLELSEDERALYEAERRRALEAFATSTGEKQRFALLAALTRLRQLSCDPGLVHEGTRVRSTKIDALLELVRDIEERGGRALVFSQFTSLLARVRAELERAGVVLLELDGSTPAAQRAQRVARWQAGEGLVFLISLKAGGTGLNLTGADWVVHLDPWWNPAVEDQATDRAHRIGQERAVTVVRLVSQGTIEEAVLGLHEDKRALARGVLEGADAAGKLDAEQLVALIREGATSETAALARSRAARQAHAE